MDKLYKNREWLYNEYNILKKPLWIIAKEQSIGYGTVHYWMSKFGIQRRNHSDCVKGNHMILTNKSKEFIYGELLGDGNLSPWKNISARYTHGSQHKKYLEWLSEILNKFGLEQSGKINEIIYKIKTGEYIGYKYQSRYYRELSSLYKAWYPKGTKHVPNDIELTPLMVRQWYIGDGCLVKSKEANPWIQLSTEAFDLRDINILIDKLLKLGIKSNHVISNNRIHISTYSTNRFIDYIGRCPENLKDIYGYKWPTTEEHKLLKKVEEKESLANKTYRSKDWLQIKYCKEKLNQREIGNICNVNTNVIRRWMHTYEIQTRYKNSLAYACS